MNVAGLNLAAGRRPGDVEIYDLGKRIKSDCTEKAGSFKRHREYGNNKDHFSALLRSEY